MSVLRSKYGEEAKAAQRLRRSAESATVSYRRLDGLYATLVGFGASLDERVADADSQLPAGEWLRECVSTPSSIFGDLCGHEVRETHTTGHSENPAAAYVRHERKTVVVP